VLAKKYKFHFIFAKDWRTLTCLVEAIKQGLPQLFLEPVSCCGNKPLATSCLIVRHVVTLYSTKTMCRKCASHHISYDVHCKKRLASFPSPVGMSLTKLSLGGNNDVIYKLFLSRESLVSDFPARDGNIANLFYNVGCRTHILYIFTFRHSQSFRSLLISARIRIQHFTLKRILIRIQLVNDKNEKHIFKYNLTFLSPRLL